LALNSLSINNEPFFQKGLIFGLIQFRDDPSSPGSRRRFALARQVDATRERCFAAKGHSSLRNSFARQESRKGGRDGGRVTEDTNWHEFGGRGMCQGPSAKCQVAGDRGIADCRLLIADWKKEAKTPAKGFIRELHESARMGEREVPGSKFQGGVSERSGSGSGRVRRMPLRREKPDGNHEPWMTGAKCHILGPPFIADVSAIGLEVQVLPALPEAVAGLKAAILSCPRFIFGFLDEKAVFERETDFFQA
jgi:hypothetical protein